MNKVRIVKDGRSTEVSEANWNNGWLAKVGWVLEQPKAPPATKEPAIDITDPIDTAETNIDEAKQDFIVTELSMLQDEYDAMKPGAKRSKVGKALKAKLDSLK